MNKTEILKEFLNALRCDLELAKEASADAAAYATHEESKADSKWDTQGLEASYLAAGQAGKAREAAQAIQRLQNLIQESSTRKENTTVSMGALVTLMISGSEELFLILPDGGGRCLKVNGSEITAVSPVSPMGSVLMGKPEGATVSLSSGIEVKILAVD